MGIITSSNQIEFESCKSLFAQIREDLDSFDALDLIDNRSLYKYVKKVISDIGIGYYMEKQAVLTVSRYKTKLPEDFYLLYSAYKCQGSDIPKGRVQPQGGYVMYLENTCEKIAHCKCDIEKVIDKVTVRTYIDEGQITLNYSNPTLLRVVNSAGNNFCAIDSPNNFHQSMNEITISDGYVNTNFEDGDIYIKYYGFPFDKEGFPMLPKNEQIKTAIEDYIKWQLFRKWYSNDSVTNNALRDKMLMWKQDYIESISNAQTEVKTPSFQTMVEYKRATNTKFDAFQFYRI